jgi:hypothetical protein
MHRAILSNRVSRGVSSSVCEAVYAEQSSIVDPTFAQQQQPRITASGEPPIDNACHKILRRA